MIGESESESESVELPVERRLQSRESEAAILPGFIPAVVAVVFVVVVVVVHTCSLSACRHNGCWSCFCKWASTNKAGLLSLRGHQFDIHRVLLPRADSRT